MLEIIVRQAACHQWEGWVQKSPQVLFTLQQILQKCRDRPTHHLFIDFKAVYDTIYRIELWNIMQRYHFPGKLIRLLEVTLNGVHYKVELDVGIVRISQGSEALVETDWRCLLFNIALEGVIRGTGLDHDIRGMILYRSLQFLGFADDIDIIGSTTAKVCEAFSNTTQTRSSKNWNENQCDEGEVPACRRQGLGGGLGPPKWRMQTLWEC